MRQPFSSIHSNLLMDDGDDLGRRPALSTAQHSAQHEFSEEAHLSEGLARCCSRDGKDYTHADQGRDRKRSSDASRISENTVCLRVGVARSLRGIDNGFSAEALVRGRFFLASQVRYRTD